MKINFTKAKILAVSLMMGCSAVSCALLDDLYDEDKASKKNSSSSSSVSEKDDVKDNDEKEVPDEDDNEDYDDKNDDSSSDAENDFEAEPTRSENGEDEFYNGYISSERSMEITKNQRNIKPDKDGFIIKNDILYDYKGVYPEVHIPDGVKKIEAHAFWSNKVVQSVYIPSSVREIGAGAFWSCPSLKYVKAEEGLKRIAGSAFWSCSSLTDVILPDSFCNAGEPVFHASNGITIHGSSGSYAEKFAAENGFEFSNESVEFVETDTENTITAAQYAYKDFTKFTIEPNIKGIESEAFQYCKKLESITIPKNVEYIGVNAFEYCKGLKTADIQGCKVIKAEAFEYCEGLEKVTIGEGTEEIGKSAFAYCRKLNDITLPKSVSSIDERAFEYCGENLTLHVDKNSYAEYFAKAYEIKYDNNK